MKTRTTQIVAGSILVVSILLAGGCKSTTTVNSVENAEPAAKKEMVSDKRIITDSSLAKKVYVVGVNDAKTPGGLLQVQLEVVNQTTSRQRFTYHVQWFDANGMQLSSTTAAILPCVIEGKETRYLSAVAPHPACKDFRVQFMEPSN
jgi:uncharacterized protein YcfL